jgi:thiamine biosynthesis lipoprotein
MTDGLSDNKITLARNAMATRFEIVLVGENHVALRAAGEEALDQVGRLDGQLSLYRSSSEIALINAKAGTEPVRVSPLVFDLLKKSKELWERTSGAFDITIAPLVRCWGFMKGTGARPTDEEILTAKADVGMQLLDLNEEECTVRFQNPKMMLDLGSIGKGYALDVAAEILRDSGISNALLHGGTSTIIGMGKDSENEPWKVVIEAPPEQERASDSKSKNIVTIIPLDNAALSVSAVWGKSFSIEGKTYGHVIDPRTGWPSESGVLAAALAPSAMQTDAFSTAVLLSNQQELHTLMDSFPYLRYLRLDRDQRIEKNLESN